MTWDEVEGLDRTRAVVILPVGAMEAHGPHLPLATDVIISQAMARAAGEALAGEGTTVLLLPPLWATAAPFAREFPGTVEARGETVTRLVQEIAGSLQGQGFRTLALANAHLDPEHLGSLREASAAFPGDPDSGIRVVFLDLTRRAVAEALGEEFRSGACHAGRFEGSMVLAEAPHWVRWDVAATLEPVPHSLSAAIREGKRSFAEAGGPQAYFGWPAEATAREGRDTIRLLGRLLAGSIREARGSDP